MSDAPNDLSLDQIEPRLAAVLNEHLLAGLAIGIVHGGDLIATRAIGMADIAANRPITGDTAFRIGSISKTFTAIALMQLWEQGKWGLDDPVNDHLQSITITPPDATAPPVTFRHLLTHTGGIGELRSWGDLVRPTIGLGAKPDQPIPTPSAYYNGAITAELPAGTKWSYANHAYNLLGQAIEDISGEPFAAYMQRHVFDPLGMDHTDFLLSDRVRDQLAQGYAFKRGTFVPVPYQEIIVRAAGSMFSSINDMARYVAALLGGGADLIRRDTLAMMLEPQFQLDPRLPAIGLSFWIDRIGDHRVYGHTGGWPGFISAMLFAPDADLGVLVFTNTSDPAPDLIANKLLRALLNEPDPADDLPRPDVIPQPHRWPELIGTYGPTPGANTNFRIWGGFGGEVEVFVRGKRLMLRSLIGPLWRGVRLYPIDRDDPLAFGASFMGSLLTVVFKRDAAGQVDRLQFGFSDLHQRQPLHSLRGALTIGAASAVGAIGTIIGRRLVRRT